MRSIRSTFNQCVLFAHHLIKENWIEDHGWSYFYPIYPIFSQIAGDNIIVIIEGIVI